MYALTGVHHQVQVIMYIHSAIGADIYIYMCVCVSPLDCGDT
jgi:hypothetical protein